MLRILAFATVVLALSKVASTSLASASNPEWALMVEGSDYAYYVDSGSITDLPNRALRFRILIDVMVPDIVAGVDAYSTVTEWVMDCNARAQGLVRVTAYKDHCGEGPELITETQHAPDLRPIIPGSAYGVAFEALCLPPDTSDEDVINFTRDSWLASRPFGPCSN
jgi:hypothetical protein